MSKFKEYPEIDRVQVLDHLDSPPIQGEPNRNVQILLNQRTRGDDDFPDFVSVVRYCSYQTKDDGEWKVDIQHKRYEENNEIE